MWHVVLAHFGPTSTWITELNKIKPACSLQILLKQTTVSIFHFYTVEIIWRIQECGKNSPCLLPQCLSVDLWRTSPGYGQPTGSRTSRVNPALHKFKDLLKYLITFIRSEQDPRILEWNKLKHKLAALCEKRSALVQRIHFTSGWPPVGHRWCLFWPWTGFPVKNKQKVQHHQERTGQLYLLVLVLKETVRDLNRIETGKASWFWLP